MLLATEQKIVTLTEVAKRFRRAHCGLSHAMNRLRNKRHFVTKLPPTSLIIPHLSPERLTENVAAGVPGRFQYGADFYNSNAVVTLELRDGHVHQLWGDGAFESALIPQGDDQFIDRAFWSDVAFVRDENGVVVEIHFDGYAAQRIE